MVDIPVVYVVKYREGYENWTKEKYTEMMMVGTMESGYTGEKVNKGRCKVTRTILSWGITCDRPVVWLVKRWTMMREQDEKNQTEGTMNGKTGVGYTGETNKVV